LPESKRVWDVAKSKKPARNASKSGKSASGGKPSAAGKAVEAANAAAESAKSTAAKAEATAAKAVETSKAVTPSTLKKDVAASNKPMPSVAKEPKEADAVKNSAAKTESVKKDAAPKAEPVAEKSKSVVTQQAAPAPQPAPEPAKKGGGFLPLVLGGLIAGGIGYAVSEFNLLNTRGQSDALATEVAALTENVGGLTEEVGAQQERLVTLEAVEPIEPVEPDLSGVTAQIEGVSAEIASVSEQITEIDARLTAVESQPLDGGGTVGDLADYERSLQALQASIEEQKATIEEQKAAVLAAAEEQKAAVAETAAAQQAQIQGLLDDAVSVKAAAAEAERKASVQSALTEITTALDSGEPFGDAVAVLSEAGIEDVPAALADSAEEGVVTLSNLQTRFSDDARAALGAARSSGEVEPEAGLGGFLKRQLSARSVAPKEGSDPDAVLSRVEAAVRDGQLDAALGEIDVLPAAAQTAMQSWLDDARARQAAKDAVQDLSNSLTAE
jgi:hypothetical protein